MNLIVCIDDGGGMLFNGRRQSKDRILRSRARRLACGQPLWMNGYTARQFAEDEVPVIIDEDFLDKAPENAWCFVENLDILPFLGKTAFLAIYRWNRLYPADVKFPVSGFEEKWELVSREDFAGSSHDAITEEVFRL